MLRVVPLDEAIRQGTVTPEQLGWSTTDAYGSFHNPKFGSVTRTAVFNGDKFVYDSYKIDEVPGSIVVPWEVDYDKRVRVGMSEAERPVPNEILLEFPRGFAEENEDTLTTAFRELLEETGMGRGATNVNYLGRTIPNPAFYESSIPVVAIQVPSLVNKEFAVGNEDLERILSVRPYTRSQVEERLYNPESKSCNLTSGPFGFFKYFLEHHHPEYKF